MAVAAMLLPCLCACTGAGAQEAAGRRKPADVVHPQLYVSLAPVPRGRTFEIGVVAEIAEGYHIQANKVLEDYLIPATLTAELPHGVKLLDTTYPPAQQRGFKFHAEPMAVYEGKILVRMKLEAAPDAPLGAVKIPLTLRYQACGEDFCLPPVKLPLAAEVEFAKPGAAAQAQHPEVFKQKP
jgi:DsbC/DsbD-like thiol-disulfide interchange protein